LADLDIVRIVVVNAAANYEATGKEEEVTVAVATGRGGKAADEGSAGREDDEARV
jgi:hypothetical protein